MREGRLYVQFDLHSTRNSNLSFEWTIHWLDSSGFVLDTAQHWTPVSIGGQGFATITELAPVPEATGFRLGVRKPNTVH